MEGEQLPQHEQRRAQQPDVQRQYRLPAPVVQRSAVGVDHQRARVGLVEEGAGKEPRAPRELRGQQGDGGGWVLVGLGSRAFGL